MGSVMRPLGAWTREILVVMKGAAPNSPDQDEYKYDAQACHKGGPEQCGLCWRAGKAAVSGSFGKWPAPFSFKGAAPTSVQMEGDVITKLKM